MPSAANSTLSTAIAAAAHELTGRGDDYEPLLELLAGARFVLLGEATHGTDEFYRERARITRRLVEEHGYHAVAVEADWADALRVNRYVRGAHEDRDGERALAGFARFPSWMWRNRPVLEFVEWLRARNTAPGALEAGFYGLDLYGLRRSAQDVVAYLERIDREAARRARARYAAGGEDQALAQLQDLLEHAPLGLRPGSAAGADHFHAVQSARVVRNAEAYYRRMRGDAVQAWNLRERHMAETLHALAQHLSRPGAPARVVVWAHNAHVGDARATDAGRRGEQSLGQLARERYGDAVRLVGFTTWSGSVTAASDWERPAERKALRPARPGSHEAAFHELGLRRFLLPLGSPERSLRKERLERAVGVVYGREDYCEARLDEQFDAVLHFDCTEAVEPLGEAPPAPSGEAPETYPAGL